MIHGKGLPPPLPPLLAQGVHQALAEALHQPAVRIRVPLQAGALLPGPQEGLLDLILDQPFPGCVIAQKHPPHPVQQGVIPLIERAEPCFHSLPPFTLLCPQRGKT